MIFRIGKFFTRILFLDDPADDATATVQHTPLVGNPSEDSALAIYFFQAANLRDQDAYAPVDLLASNVAAEQWPPAQLLECASIYYLAGRPEN